jgi:MYXO-CTERM domain-containing protein
MLGRGLALVALIAGVAHADRPVPTKVVKVPPSTEHAGAVQKLFFNRCVGGCRITKGGSDDVRTRNSVVPEGPVGTEYTLSEFAWDDDVWNEMMQCLREVYSPYDIEITDVQPGPGIPYNEGLVAGSSRELDTGGFFGVAAISNDCSARTYAMSFSMANDIGPNPLALCYVAAQETAHSFGLNGHSYEYLDGRSACNDPMSYRSCGGQRFFRNEPARCGDFQLGDNGCGCGPTHNTHQRLTQVLGPGTPLTAAPTVSVTSHQSGQTIANGAAIVARAFSQRGVHRVELLLNGYKWAEVPGVGWGNQGQPEASYSLVLPPDVPDGVIDIVVRAKDDIDMATETPVITVTKGAPCTSADTCAEGQLCEAGKCFWAEPVGELGDECTFKQFCINELCQAIDSGESRCVQPCVLGVADTCPAGYECLASNVNSGVCWPSSDLEGNCLGCSNTRGGSIQGVLFALGLGYLVFRRRRRT